MTNSTANANCFIIDLVFGEKTLYNIWRDRRMRDVSPMIDDHLDCGNCSTSSHINIDGTRDAGFCVQMFHVMMCSHFDGWHRANDEIF